MASAKTLLYKHKTLKNKKHPILIQLIKDRKRRMISLGYSATPGEWNEGSGLPTKKHPNSVWLSNLIKNKISEVDNIRIELEAKGKPYTIDDWARRIKNKQEQTTVFNFTDELITRLK